MNVFGFETKRVGSALAQLLRRRNRTPYGVVEGVLGPRTSGPKPRVEYLAAFNETPWLRQSVAKVAQGIASTEWVLKAVKNKGKYVRADEFRKMPPAVRRKGLSKLEADGSAETIKEHPLLTLLNEPNKVFGAIPLAKLDATYFELLGESLTLIGRGRFLGRAGRPLPDSFWPIPPHWVQETPTPDFPSFRVSYRGWQAVIPMQDVHWRVNLNALNPYGRGIGIVPALAQELDADSSAAKLVNHAFYNKNAPDLLISLPGWTKEAVTAYANDWRAHNQGIQNVMRTHFVNADAKAEKLGNDFRAMQMIDMRRFGRDSVREVLGLPPEVLGIIENSNRATIDAADFIFGKHVLEPRLEEIREFRQRMLVEEYDPRLILDYISPVEGDKEFALRVGTTQPHVLSIDEWRELMGRPPLEGDQGKMFVFAAQPFAVKDMNEILKKEEPAGPVGPDGQPIPPAMGADGQPVKPALNPDGTPNLNPDGTPKPATDAQGNEIPDQPRLGEEPSRLGESFEAAQAQPGAPQAKPGVPPKPGAPPPPPGQQTPPQPGQPMLPPTQQGPKPVNPFQAQPPDVAQAEEQERLRRRVRSLARIAKMERVRKKLGMRLKYEDSQPRADDGKWTDGGGGGGSSDAKTDANKGPKEQGGPSPESRARDISDPEVDAFALKTSSGTTVPPSTGKVYNPDVEQDANGDGVTDVARVGVPADEVPPPPRDLPRLPNLTAAEREAEDAFSKKFESNPEQAVADYNAMRMASKDPRVFETDAAKALMPEWQQTENRGLLNTPLHQAANAIAKRAFSEHLDTLQPGSAVLVTAGGCGAGKGFALKGVPDAVALKDAAGAIWDSAGDQNSTELTWIKGECDRRGLKMQAVYVHADPFNAWADPERGVVKRASDPKDGRMVDADVFADSYVYGGRNFKAFAEKNKDVNVLYIDNRGKPKRLDSFPEDAAKVDRAKLYDHAMKTISERQSTLPPSIVRGATIGRRIWRKQHEQPATKAAPPMPQPAPAPARNLDVDTATWGRFLIEESEKLGSRKGNPAYALPEGTMEKLHAEADEAVGSTKPQEAPAEMPEEPEQEAEPEENEFEV